ncbi:MAG: hypothetical protein C0501_13590 [Isosphaera sp.]|nr:hypothetical protein [Isosphaera sp.]
MDDPTADAPPGCLVILTALSAGMGEDARVWFAHRHPPDGDPEVRDVPGAVAARFLADELIEGLVNTAAAGYPVPLDVAVLGYRADEAGAVQFVPLLPGADAARPVPLAGLVDRPVDPRGRDGDPRKWTAPAGCDGTAPAAAALAEAYRLVAVWLTGRYLARPPVVVHLTAGEGLDADYARVARSLGLLATAYGPARLLHVGFAPGVEPTLAGGWGDALPGPWAGLFAVSAELPAEDGGRPARRAVSVNDWTLADVWSALFDLAPVGDPGGWADPDAGRFDPAAARGLWAEKMGNTPEQWEDAFASDPAGGVAAVADGASTGIYCRAWADRLAAAFVATRPEVRDPAALAAWVDGLRAEWRAGIDYDNLNWSKKAKVDSVGAAATLLGLEVGPARDDGARPWRAAAVGDATLFWVRGGDLVATFPVVAADQFGSAPLLVRSNPGYKTLPLAAAGECRPGDRFFLATDAVAARLLKSAGGVDWGHFETVDEAAWRADLDALRRANDMVNDDCTLVVLAVAPSVRAGRVSDGPPSEPEPPEQTVADASGSDDPYADD